MIYGYPHWSHGRVYYDLSKHLSDRGYIVDILNWQGDHSAYIEELKSFYDLFLTALDGVKTLIDSYCVAPDRILAVSHHEFDIRMLIEQRGAEVLDRFAGYGVVSEFLYSRSLMSGVARVPRVVGLGINFSEFYAEVSNRLTTVGYASSMSVKTYGVEWKRGALAEAATREAGLSFKVAGSTGLQTSFHDMPEFYKSVGAVVTSSISEAAQLPVMEAAAAGRLVICTPVGHFPEKAYLGAGILAPIEADKFRRFTASTLRFYADNPAAYVAKCLAIQEAARKFDWQHAIGDWIDFIEESANLRRIPAPAHAATEREGEPEGVVVENVISGQRIRFLVTNRNDAIMRHHYDGQFYEAEELDIIKASFSRGGVFVDIGSNVGNHAIYVSKFMDAAKIIAFEPNPKALAILRRNLQLNDCENVETRFLGIALGKREAVLHSVTVDADNLGHTCFYEDTNGAIPSRTGDSLLFDEPISFIKLDVEGMEMDILAGLERTIARWRPNIFIEVWDRQSEPFFDWCKRSRYAVVQRYQRYDAIQNYLVKPEQAG